MYEIPLTKFIQHEDTILCETFPDMIQAYEKL